MQENHFNVDAEFTNHSKTPFLKLILLYILQSGNAYPTDNVLEGSDDLAFRMHAVREIQKANQLISSLPSPQKRTRVDDCILKLFPMYSRRADALTLTGLIFKSFGGGKAAKDYFKVVRANGKTIPTGLDDLADRYDQLHSMKSAVALKPTLHDLLNGALHAGKFPVKLLHKCIECEYPEMTMYLLEYGHVSLSDLFSHIFTTYSVMDYIKILNNHVEFFLKLIDTYQSAQPI